MNKLFALCLVFAALFASANAGMLNVDQAESIEGLARRGLLNSGSAGWVEEDSVTTSQSVACADDTSCELTYTLDTGFESNKVYWYALDCEVDGASCLLPGATDVVDGSGSVANGVCTSSPCTLDGLTADTTYYFYTVSSDGTTSYPNSDGEFAGTDTTYPTPPEVTSLTLTSAPADGVTFTAEVVSSDDATFYWATQVKCCNSDAGTCVRVKVCPLYNNVNYNNLNPTRQSGTNTAVVSGTQDVNGDLPLLRTHYDYYFCYYVCDSYGQCSDATCILYEESVAPSITAASAEATADGAVISVSTDRDATITYTGDASGSFSSSDGSVTVTGLAESTEYSVTITATNDFGDSESTSVTWTTLDETAPTTSVSVGEITQTTAVISVSSDEEVTVYYVVAEAGVEVTDFDVIDSGAVFDTTDLVGTGFQLDLAGETDYTVHAIACDASGNCGALTSTDFTSGEIPPNTATWTGGESQSVDGAFLIVFDVPVVESTIESAELALPVASGEDGSTFSVYRINTAWNPDTADATCAAYLDGACATGAEWDIVNQDGTANTASATGTYDASTGWVTFDVTDDVTNFAAGEDNFGWAVVTDSGDVIFVEAGTEGLTPELRITYPDGDATDSGIDAVCEGNDITISCSGGNVISISSVVWGRSNANVCPSDVVGENDNTQCSSDSAFGVVSLACNGETSCTVSADVATLGDPCASTAKYLEGRYQCVASNDIDNFCRDIDCGNGQCVNSVNGGTCVCDEGFEGANCDQEIVLGDLVLHWVFDDETATDISGFENHGTVKNGKYDAGVDGRGVSVGVNNGNGHVKAADSESLRLAADWTVAVFAAPRSDARNPGPNSDKDSSEQCDEWQSVDVSCPRGLIRINNAHYGKGDSCRASGGLTKVSAECNGRTACRVPATNSYFGDPCYGTFKELIVSYTCEHPMHSGFLVSGGAASNDFGGANSFGIFQTTDSKYGSTSSTTAVIERATGRQVIGLDGAVDENAWNFVALTFSEGVQTLYVNGEAVSQEANLGPSLVSEDGFWLGNDNQDAKGQFSGNFDNVKVWTYALTAEEIAAERAPFVGIGLDLPEPKPTGQPTKDVCTSPNKRGSSTGCADGTREGFLEEADIAACAGGWDVPGMTSDESRAPQCGRNAGNDGSDLAGCSVADVCAAGFHVCESAEEVRAKTASKAGCDDVSAWTDGFYATRQSGTGNRYCASTGQNDVFGCGTQGDPVIRNCGGLNRFSHNVCNAISSTGWACPSSAGLTEITTVTHSSNVGGVLCCRDDKKTNSAPAPEKDAKRIALYVDEEPSEDEIEVLKAAVGHFAVCGSKKSRCGFTRKQSTGGHTIKSGGTRRSRCQVSVKAVCQSSSGKSGSSKGASNGRGRKLLGANTQRTVLIFDVKGTSTATADEAAASIARQAATTDSELSKDFPTVSGAETMSTCGNGEVSTSCYGKEARAETELPAGTVGDGYGVEGSELSNNNPVVIGLVSTIAVLVVLTLAGFAYRYKNQEKQQSFDGRVLEEEAQSSDRVEMDVVPSASHAAKKGEQETYWVFNRGAAESSDANVRVLV